MISHSEPKPVRVLDADVYDALELSALAFGGIGQPAVFEYDPAGRVAVPICILGHCGWASANTSDVESTEMARHVRRVFPEGAGFTSDNAVLAINERHSDPPATRVPFAAWCAELGVVRGPHPVAADA